MTTMQDHPIDLVRDQMALVAQAGGRGLLGLACGLALIGALWLGTLKPADAAGGAAWRAEVVAQSAAGGHLGAAPAWIDGMAPDRRGALVVSLSVCRLVIDPKAEAPLAQDCAAN